MDAPRRRRRWGRIVLGLAGGLGATAVAAVVALALVISSFDGCELQVGPGDGRHSRHVDVEAAPTEGLADGTTVFVTSRAFAPAHVVGITVCLTEADTERAGVEACDTDAGLRVTVADDGAIRAPYAVPRVITVDGTAVDCASEPRRCTLVAADAGDYDTSGGVALSFAADLPAVDPRPAPPRARSVLLPGSLAPAGPLRGPTTVTATASGFLPGEPLVVGLCSSLFLRAEVWEACVPADDRVDVAMLFLANEVHGDPHRADEHGTAVVDVEVTPRIGTDDGLASSLAAGPTDCTTAPGRCGVVVAAAADTQRSSYIGLTFSP